MGSILGAYLMPHPPIVVPEVGKGGETGANATIQAMEKVSVEIASLKPGVVILITPHGPVFNDHIFINRSQPLKGDLRRFGARHVSMEFENDPELVHKIVGFAAEDSIRSGDVDEHIIKRYGISRDLDHGALVPLHFVRKQYAGFRLIHLALAMLDFRTLYKFGTCIAKAIASENVDAVIIASGDLSHKLTHDGPYGYDPFGPVFDNKLVDLLTKANVPGILDIEEGLAEEAGECGLKSIIIMLGALDGFDTENRLYSYEGPFGVGYAVASLIPLGKNKNRQFLEVMDRNHRDFLRVRKKNEDAYVALARQSLESYVRRRRELDVPDGLPPEMIDNTAGVFVSIKKNKSLRGCIGTTAPTRKNIAEEIIQNAISSGTADPRFPPVTGKELDDLVYSVDVLGNPQPIQSMADLDVKKYGVIVRAGRKSGLLLPDLDGVDTPEKQVAIALQKAGIRQEEKYAMERFEVIRHV